MSTNSTNLSEEFRYRYPGPRPFTYNDRHIFRGRQREVLELQELLRQYQHLLLYARSGIGKSSLIEAGLLPAINLKGGYLPFKIIFGAYNKKEPISPLDTTILYLQQLGSDLSYLDKLIFKEDSLWYHIKRLQVDLVQKNAKAESSDSSFDQQTILLIFDQFEELFTYPTEDIIAFKQALSEALFTQIPEVFRDALRSKDASSNLTEEELTLLHLPPTIRVLFSIRSDRVALLNRLTDCLPELLKNFYEIFPLNREQTTQAIVEPALIDGNFESSKFSYAPPFLQEMLDFLAKDQEQYVESFQIQILCKYIEDLVKANPARDLITKSDVPVLENIFYSFYENAIAKVPAMDWYGAQELNTPNTTLVTNLQHHTRQLIEKSLVFRTGEETGIRLNLYREQIAQQHPEVDDACLLALTRERLLRETPDAAGRMRYELSHDTLVKPILRALDDREREIKERADREERLRLDREEAERRSRAIGVSGEVEIEWDYIVSKLKQGRVALILGENALKNREGVPLIERFAQKFTSLDDTYYTEEQLFAFKTNVDKAKTAYALKKYYENLNSAEIPLLDRIAKVPIKLIISFDPSGLLEQALSRLNHTFETTFFRTSKKNSELVKNIKNHRYIYNLFGSIQDEDSLLLTFEDTYHHLAEILRIFPENLQKALHQIDVILMCGINFNRSTNESILWHLMQYNEKALKMVVTDAPDLSKEELRIKSILNFNFQQVDPKAFFEELRTRAFQGTINLSSKTHLEKKLVREMIEKGQTDRALQTLMQYLREIEGERFYNDVIILMSRLNGLERQNRLGTIFTKDSNVEENKIRSAVLALLEDID